MLDFEGLDVGAVGQHNSRQFRGGGSRMDRAPIAVLGELREQAAMIDMGVAEDNCGEIAGHEGKRAVVQLLLGFRTLEHPVIDQNLPSIRLQAKT
jgi:hypothetical protein